MKKIILLLIMLITLCGCNTVISESSTNTNTGTYDLSIDTADKDASYSINGSTYITLGSEDVHINKAGTYILEGTLDNASIIVEASKDDKIQLVLNGVTINANDFAGIYIIEADEVTVTLNEGTVNTISDNSEYVQIDSNSVDALIFSKADLVFNGTGTLKLNSSYHHGVVSKDDLSIMAGTYVIDVAGQGLSGKDCVKISDGDFTITSGKDAIKSDNDEDEARGYVYITGGNFNINTGADAIYGLNMVTIDDGDFTITTSTSNTADSYKAIKSDKEVTINNGTFTINSADDAIHSNGNVVVKNGTFDITTSDDALHADELLQIDGGEFVISAHEAIEATYILINDGNMSIYASDDAINAAQKSSAYTATLEINGGYITINMGQGDTDAIDSNGNIVINGGTLDITAQSAFDYDGTAEYNGGTIIVNGTETNQITNQMMGGGMPGMGMMPGGNMQGENPSGRFRGRH